MRARTARPGPSWVGSRLIHHGVRDFPRSHVNPARNGPRHERSPVIAFTASIKGDCVMEDRIRLSITDGIADVRLNRADKMNALDPAMFKAIADTGARLKQNTSVRAIVLSGEGRAFCAGLDVERITALTRGANLLPFADLTKRTHGIANFVQHIVWIWREIAVPVIAAVHGVAFGGGFQLARCRPAIRRTRDAVGRDREQVGRPRSARSSVMRV